MDLICNPCQPREMVLNMKDCLKFVKLTTYKPKNDALTNNDFTLTSATLPNLPQHVDSNNITCMEWCASSESTIADSVAVGFTSGKVAITWPGTEHSASKTHANHSRIYNSSKPCTALSWNKMQPSLLAIGTEKNRSDSSLFVLDRTVDITEPPSRGDAKISTEKLPVKPLHETCFGEAVNSLMWTRNESKSLIAGVGAKYLRMYELRNIRSPSCAVSTRAVFGICQDPCLDTRFSSYVENQINIWDLRNFSKPAAIISTKYNIVKADWCPTRKGLLATISTGSDDGHMIRVYDMNHTMVTDSDPDIAYRHVEQIVNLEFDTLETVGTFCWMEDTTNHLIAVTNTGTLHCVNVPERISLCWKKDSRLISACKQLHECNFLKKQQLVEEASSLFDIEQIIYKRALNGYGIRNDVAHHDPKINLEYENEPLSAFWKWIQLEKDALPVENSHDAKPSPINSRSIKGSLQLHSNRKFSGLLTELSTQIKSTSESIDWVGVSGVKCTIYNSPQRTRALKICGWSQIDESRNNESHFKESLLNCSDVERAAAVALWHLDMRLAINILQQQKDGVVRNSSEYSIVAMALSGYPGNGASPLWREMCSNLQKSMPSPYLRAAFAFLNVLGNGLGTHNDILKEKDISNADRVGFACMYLPDDRLLDVLDTLCDSAVRSGDLEGVVATGLTTDRGIQLMQSYVDRTKDVQTAALSLIQTGSFEILKNHNALHMIEGYKSLLNAWMLWKERALVDIAIGKMNTALHASQSLQGIFVQCNYCSKSVRNTTRMPHMRGRIILQGHGMMSKSTSCPSCRKPLPKCSVCCMYLGTSSTDLYDKTDKQNGIDNDLECWFTWCTKCQHGGHTNHMTTWFNEHIDCPLPGCGCKCSGIKED